METDELPLVIEAVCAGQRLPPGRRWLVDESPTLAAPRPLILTSPEPPAMVYPLQCGTPASPCLAAAGTFYLHQSLKPWLPSINLSMLLCCMRRRRHIWQELDHVIKVLGYVLISVEREDLISCAHDKSMRHVNR